MTKDRLITVRDNVSREEAMRLLHQYRIEKLLVVDGDYRCIGLITVKDIEKAQNFPDAAKDEQGRLFHGGVWRDAPDAAERTGARTKSKSSGAVVGTETLEQAEAMYRNAEAGSIRRCAM